MPKMGDHFRRGKLQVARFIIEELSRIYVGKSFQVEFATAWYALNRADAALIAEVEKPSHNTRMVAALRKKYLPGTDRDSRWYNQAIDDCIETLQCMHTGSSQPTMH